MILASRGNETRSNNKPIELRNYHEIRIFRILMFCSEAAPSYILLILMIYFI